MQAQVSDVTHWLHDPAKKLWTIKQYILANVEVLKVFIITYMEAHL